jgi:hypothetical protein
MFDAYACIAVFLGIILVEALIIAGLAKENRKLRALIAPFDRDGDGRIGGSVRRVR